MRIPCTGKCNNPVIMAHTKNQWATQNCHATPPNQSRGGTKVNRRNAAPAASPAGFIKLFKEGARIMSSQNDGVSAKGMEVTA